MKASLVLGQLLKTAAAPRASGFYGADGKTQLHGAWENKSPNTGYAVNSPAPAPVPASQAAATAQRPASVPRQPTAPPVTFGGQMGPWTYHSSQRANSAVQAGSAAVQATPGREMLSPTSYGSVNGRPTQSSAEFFDNAYEKYPNVPASLLGRMRDQQAAHDAFLDPSLRKGDDRAAWYRNHAPKAPVPPTPAPVQPASTYKTPAPRPFVTPPAPRPPVGPMAAPPMTPLAQTPPYTPRAPRAWYNPLTAIHQFGHDMAPFARGSAWNPMTYVGRFGHDLEDFTQ